MKVLKFSEYRIEYAREIVKQWDEQRRVMLDLGMLNMMVSMYSTYLFICGFKDISEDVSRLKEKTYQFDNFRLKANNGLNPKYDKDFVENINKEIDNLIERIK